MQRPLERSGIQLFDGVPTDIWPDALIIGSETVSASAKVGLEAVAATVSAITRTEKELRLPDNPAAGPELMRVGMPLLEKAAVTVGSVLDQLAKQKTTAQAAVSSALKIEEPPMGAEIRNHLRSLGKDARGAVLEAIQDGDQDVVAAALHGPAMLSGLNKEVQRELRAIAAGRFAPEATKLIEDIDRATAKLERSQAFLTDTARQSRNKWLPSSAAVNRLQERMAEKARNPEGRPQL